LNFSFASNSQLARDKKWMKQVCRISSLINALQLMQHVFLLGTVEHTKLIQHASVFVLLSKVYTVAILFENVHTLLAVYFLFFQNHLTA